MMISLLASCMACLVVPMLMLESNPMNVIQCEAILAMTQSVTLILRIGMALCFPCKT